MHHVVRKELRGPGGIVIAPADHESIHLQKLLLDLCISPILYWSSEVDSHNTLPRLSQLRDDIRDCLPSFVQVYNGLSRSTVTHFCWQSQNSGGPGPCCANKQATLDTAKKGLNVLLSLLTCGSSVVNGNKWFSVSCSFRVLEPYDCMQHAASSAIHRAADCRRLSGILETPRSSCININLQDITTVMGAAISLGD